MYIRKIIINNIVDFNMKKSINIISLNFLKFALTLFIITFSINISAQQDPDKSKDSKEVVEEYKDDFPALSDVIPQASSLSDKLFTLEGNIKKLIDASDIKEEYLKISETLKKITNKFNELKKEKNVNVSEYDKLKVEITQADQSFVASDNSLTESIDKLESARDEWLKDKKKWTSYQKHLLIEELPDEAKNTLIGANKTIEKALDIIVVKLNSLMKVQQMGYNNQSIINDLSSQILVFRQKKIVSSFEKASIPMYSSKFYHQFDGSWTKIKRGISTVILPSASFFQNHWWVHLFQIFITILVIYLIQINKNVLKNSEKYSYLSDRAFSAGLFFGVVFVIIYHIEVNAPPIWNLFSFIIGGLAFGRLIETKKVTSWKNQFLRALVIIIIVTGIFDVFNFPIALFRVYILGVSLIGIYMLYSWNKKNKQTIKSKKHLWFFNSVSVYLVVVIISEFIGKEVLALYMYEAFLKSIMLIAFVYVFLKIIQVGIAAGLKTITKGNKSSSSEIIHKTVIRITTVISLLTIMFVIPRILVIWGVYKNISDAFDKLIAIGFNVWDVKISLGVIISSISILYLSNILSTILELILMNDKFDKDLDKGTRLSMAQLLRYFLLFVGFIIAIATLGFNLTSLTIVLSALSVGIGFGLQGLVNNFVSGLILLFEQPIREGDTIELDEEWSEVKKIGLRSTTVQTFDQSDVIIPNADLVYNKVTNWTLRNRRRRIKILVGVAYGSDISLVIERLKEIGSSNTDLVKSHKPDVLFRDFANSTLNFELRVWAKDALDSIQVESNLRQEIDKVFRENNIEIAFPQRDLHIRSVDKEIILKALTNTAVKPAPRVASKPASKAKPKSDSKTTPKK